MKKIYLLLMALMTLCTAMTLSSCSDDDPFSTASVNDYPRILDPTFPDRANGQLAVFESINRNDTLDMKVTVTPADYTKVTYFLDGTKVSDSTEYKTALEAGTYTVKIVATIPETGKQTDREGYVIVKPLDGDPYSQAVGSERIIAPGSPARLYGRNLSAVKSLKIGGTTVDKVTYGEESGQEYLDYVVPESLAAGTYRVSLITANAQYGAETVTATKEALAVSGFNRANASSIWTIKGINLDRMASITIADKTITSFTVQSPTELAFMCPALANGDYKISGKTKDGHDLEFYASTGNTTTSTVTISSETTVWEGHHYVNWSLKDGDPDKTFNEISKNQFDSFKPGSILRIYYTLNTSDSYHQMETTSGCWNNLPGTNKIDLTADGVKEITITQDMIDKVNSEDGFLIVGYGFYVDRVTIQ
ncbi:MAG: hypothetical protein LKF48_11635 [Prevotella sp.]|jgi:hypothetical protein|nr:hypothetical protein [Prevotella sp.]MCH4183784.1 hypothetical protein [Prevotella sp.]